MSLTVNVKEKADLIWAIADKLTGVYKPHEYGDVILPLTVIRRFDCVLEATKDKVLAASKLNMPEAFKERALCEASGFPFYNISKYTFATLLNDADNITANFKAYLNGFSANVRQIIEKFNFEVQIDRMSEKKILYIVLEEFTKEKGDFHPDKVSDIEMGYVFEEIIRKFSESSNEDAGQHYTPREVIRLMVNILFMEDNDILTKPDVVKTIYDPACGTGGMLSVASEYLKKLNSSAALIPFGEEINDQTFAVCQADILIKGENPTNIKVGNTLSDDQFKGDTFDYQLSNPPFGREWKNEKNAVLKEAKEGYNSRFGPGLPAVGDSQMLFLETVIAKMKPQGGRAAIIHNGSPLFTSDAGSGPSEIRRFILEHDLLEAIIALPNDIFYNTGIATYIWVLSNRKAPYRKGKVQLINANGIYTKMRKSLGSKRVEISPEQIEEITRMYGDFKETELCKIFDTTDFGYQKITVERPLRYVAHITDETLGQVKTLMTKDDVFTDIPAPAQLDLFSEQTDAASKKQAKLQNEREDLRKALEILEVLKQDEPYLDVNQLAKAFDGHPLQKQMHTKVKFRALANLDRKSGGLPYGAPLIEVSPEGAPYVNAKKELVPDPDLRDTENVPLKERIDTYMQNEVLPFVPDAWVDEKKTLIGYEIPFTRYFYHYEPPKPALELETEIRELALDLEGSLSEIFGE